MFMELMIEGEKIKGYCENCDKEKIAIVHYVNDGNNNIRYAALCKTCFLEVKSPLLDKLNAERQRLLEYPEYDFSNILKYMSDNKLNLYDISNRTQIDYARLSLLFEGLGIPSDEEMNKLNSLKSIHNYIL